MKKYFRFVVAAIASLFITGVALAQFSYVNPSPGSKYNTRETTLALRNGSFIDEASVLKKGWLEINGSKSGAHQWTARLSDDKKTIVVKPQSRFFYGETVSITILSKLKTASQKIVNGMNYSFSIRDTVTEEDQKEFMEAQQQFYLEPFGYNSLNNGLRDFEIDSFPDYTVTINNNAAPGQMFWSNQDDSFPESTNCFLAITENNGSLVWARDVDASGHDFKINYNGYMTFFRFSTNYWVVMDSNYNYIDSFTAENGYFYYLNPHDIALYPDGHAIILIADKLTMDLTAYGGKSNAKVTGVVIQEQDANHDVVWEWSGWDHLFIDETDPNINITGKLVDYVHANAVNRDDDGNILLSLRHFDQINKIDPATGDFIWRLNGVHNEFTFVNDNIPEHFAFQHDVHRIDNGHITLFNNANFLDPQRSSAKEYALDEVNKVATLSWYYEHPDDYGNLVYTPGMGSVQRLPNGNTLISWATPTTFNPGRPSMTEVDSNKNIVWEMKFTALGQKTYRVHKYVWNPCEMPKPGQVSVSKITDTSAKISWSAINSAVSYDLQYRKAGNANWKMKTATGTSKKLKNLKPGKTYEYQLRTHCLNGYTSDWTPLATFKTLPAKYFEEENAVASVLYPNPASDILNLYVEADEAQSLTFSVYDVSGKELLSEIRNISEAEQLLTFDVSALPSGIYFAHVKMNSGMEVMKVVKE